MKIKQIFPNARVMHTGEYLVGAFEMPQSFDSIVCGFDIDSLDAVEIPLEDVVWLRVADPERGNPAKTQRPHKCTMNAYSEDTGEDLFNAFVCDNLIYAFDSDYKPVTLSFAEVEFKDRIWSFLRPPRRPVPDERSQVVNLKLSKRAKSSLKVLGILTDDDLKEKALLCDWKALRSIPNCGTKTAREILAYIEYLKENDSAIDAAVETNQPFIFAEDTPIQDRILCLVSNAEDGITAKDIAEKLKVRKTKINKLLYGELSSQCEVDSVCHWRIKQQ